jgi:hypothetical protein
MRVRGPGAHVALVPTVNLSVRRSESKSSTIPTMDAMNRERRVDGARSKERLLSRAREFLFGGGQISDARGSVTTMRERTCRTPVG